MRGAEVQCMVKPIIILFLVLAFTSCADFGGGSSSNTSVSLAWDPSPSEGVVGYKIYIGKAKGNYYKTYDVGNVQTYTLKNLGNGTYYFVCTAYDSFGNESGYSNEVYFTR